MIKTVRKKNNCKINKDSYRKFSFIEKIITIN